jgi:hypothetical protein
MPHSSFTFSALLPDSSSFLITCHHRSSSAWQCRLVDWPSMYGQDGKEQRTRRLEPWENGGCEIDRSWRSYASWLPLIYLVVWCSSSLPVASSFDCCRYVVPPTINRRSSLLLRSDQYCCTGRWYYHLSLSPTSPSRSLIWPSPHNPPPS